MFNSDYGEEKYWKSFRKKSNDEELEKLRNETKEEAIKRIEKRDKEKREAEQFNNKFLRYEKNYPWVDGKLNVNKHMLYKLLPRIQEWFCLQDADLYFKVSNDNKGNNEGWAYTIQNFIGPQFILKPLQNCRGCNYIEFVIKKNKNYKEYNLKPLEIKKFI